MDPITINLVILAASFILSKVLAPKPQKPKPTVCAFGLAPIGYLLACVLNQLERERVAGRD